MWTLLRRFHKKKSGTDGLKNRRESQPDGSESSRALTQHDDHGDGAFRETSWLKSPRQCGQVNCSPVAALNLRLVQDGPSHEDV